ncbi:cytochrome P450 CYP82D47-like [Durio zibethinus]|uniref:Cytochrome P450 CYP82D47-like n=1 Tax=Durio zibethinus TaxID=66656 RepID=A0A6P6AYG0_DURZI|nr:cytochrome P450 CYP82D47-like [Durio zibethinus]
MDFSSLLAAVTGILGLVLFYKLWKEGTHIHQSKCRLLAPEPSGALPFIGHMHLLGGKRTLSQTWGAMADKYGPIFTIRLGVFPARIISNHEAVKECFTTNDRVLANRPRSNAGIYLGYDHAGFGFAPDGEYWRKMRKLAMVELLSSRRLEILKHVQFSEVNAFIKDLYSFYKTNEQNPDPKLAISHKFEVLTLNTMIRLITGKRYFSDAGGKDEEAAHVTKVVKDFMYISGLLAPSEVIPFLGWMDSIFVGQVKSMKHVAKEIDSIVGTWVEEHKLKRLKSEPDDGQDFIDLLLSAIEEDSMFGYTRETIIKATVMNLFLAGSDTTSITLTWILSNLMNNRQALSCAQEELDLKVGRGRWAQDSDIEKLVYLQAVIKETLRLYPPGPISSPHEAREDCSIGGYLVRKGTRVITNLWKLHRDPRIWSNAVKFQPERFLTSHANVDVLGQHFELIPFGSGRRSCPGMTLALQMTHLTMACLLQGFDLTTPFDKPVDMTEGLGITMPKATPLEVILSPRLPAAMYVQL